MTVQPDNYSRYVPLLKLVFVGVLIGSLVAGGIALDVIALTLFLAALLILGRGDRLYAAIAILLGVAIVIVFPQFNLQTINPVAAVACIGVMIFI